MRRFEDHRLESETVDLVQRAAGLTHSLLAEDPRRLRHSASVAAQAQQLVPAVGDEGRPLLVAAAWLHDIGYAPALQHKGFHPLDGARRLQDEGWHPVICDLVANHSGSRFLAADRGLSADLAAFPYVETPLSDALTVADQTTGPNGEPMTVEERMREVLARHGPDSVHVRVYPLRGRYIRLAARRVTERLRAAGIAPIAQLNSASEQFD